MALPAIPITFTGPAYRNSSVYYQSLASHAWHFISIGQPQHALESLNKLLADQDLDSNPLIIETYMMLGKMALDRQDYAEACVDFQRAAQPRMLMCARRGSDRENLPIYEATEAVIKYLQAVLRKPRMLNRRSRKFADELDFMKW
ncbi:hypothetical protein AURDEDRAFT_162239 [Auricularia subglabra TFB-10046 SS5]|nr:hypothetical protein AURDEDRAFT_162239 [Auricularia subglabra TFB-10046 SS5]